jgi:CheY-like chemotaxis protein
VRWLRWRGGREQAEAALLVVDDNENNRCALTRRLAREGYRNVATAVDGSTGLAEQQSIRPRTPRLVYAAETCQIPVLSGCAAASSRVHRERPSGPLASANQPFPRLT